MFCRKCGKQIADNSASCPECGANLAELETKKLMDVPVVMTEVVENEKKFAVKDKKKPAIIVAIAVIIVVAAIFLLAGSEKGTFEGYSWDMTKSEVEKKVAKSTDWITNTDSETDENELSYKGTYEGYTSLILFEFAKDSTLESVSVYPISTSEDGAAAAFETHKSKLQSEYGEPETLPNITGYAKWTTETSHITAMVIIDSIVAVTYKRVEPTE